jgi:16S rRNA (cytosine967-C5)-methyltransferase
MSDTKSARARAAAIVERILTLGVTLDAALEGDWPSPKLKAATQSLSYGAVRGYHRYHATWTHLSEKPIRAWDARVKGILAVAFFELEEARSPQYAVVDAAVESAKSGPAARAGGLINALLRRYLRERATLDLEIARRPAHCHAAPQWLAERLREDWPGRWTQILAACDRQAPLWLRVNPRISTAEAYAAKLREAGTQARLEPSVPQALMLETAMDVRELPGFDEGWVSVQDLGAQLAYFPLELSGGLRVLDACAAPGGKTALMAEREPNLNVTAVDVDGKRLERVRQTLKRLQLAATVLQGDARDPQGWWDGVPFDRILLDAPCSALGVIRRHPDIKLRKTPADLDPLPAVQSALLKASWSMLKSGGRLVYATCTLTRSENRDVVGRFLEETGDALPVPPERWGGWPGFGQNDGVGRQILPGEAQADGFYYAAIQKQ